MKRILALAVILPLAACQNPNGSTNWPETLGLGAGLGFGAAALGGLFNDSSRNQRYGGYGHYPRHGGFYGRQPVYQQPYHHPGYGYGGRW